MKRFYKERSVLCLLLVIMAYAVMAFSRLGTANSPDSFWNCEEKGQEILLDFGQKTDIAAIVYYLGNYGNRGFSLEYGIGNPIQWRTTDDLRMVQVYQWRASGLNTTCQYIKLTTKNVYTQIGELLFIDREGKTILPVNVDAYPELFDESDCYLGKSTYETGTVFDEPVYARTAYEYLNGERPFEDTHPPLGKLLIAPGIALFGMNPVGWRFMGVLAGVSLLILIAVFSRKVFEDPWISVAVTAFLAFDFMCFTHSRLAQADTFLVFFISGSFISMYYFAERMLEKNGPVDWKKSIKYLLISGGFWGAAISCKWSGAYILPELIIIAILCMLAACGDGRLTKGQFKTLFGWGIISYALIPLSIYVLSYIPYISVDQELGFWEGMIQNQINMFRYHSELRTVNPESAKWFQWPLIAVPMTYCNLEINGMKECVYLLGNPVFWIAGLAAVFYCIYDVLDRGNKKSVFFLVMYLAPLLPWILISRSSFLYHYFPSLPALALMLGHFGDRMKKGRRWIMFLLVSASVITFAVFYPILSGVPVSAKYVEMLEWLPWWDF